MKQGKGAIWIDEVRETLMWLLTLEYGAYDTWATRYYPKSCCKEEFVETTCKEFADYLNACYPNRSRPVTAKAVVWQVNVTLWPPGRARTKNLVETALANRRAARKVGFLP